MNGVIGYFGVIAEKYDLWQGFYLNSSFEEVGRDILRDARAVLAKSGLQSDIKTAVDHLDPLDQQVCAALTATLVEVTTVHRDQMRVGAVAMALHLLTGWNYFLVVGDRRAAGTGSSIERLNVGSVDAARDRIRARPEVALIQQRLAGEREGQHRKRGFHH